MKLHLLCKLVFNVPIPFVHIFSFLCCELVFMCFVCLLPVSCVPGIPSFSGLSILDDPFGLL